MKGRLAVNNNRATFRDTLLFAPPSSGGYERDVTRVLLAAGILVRRINLNQLRQFARAEESWQKITAMARQARRRLCRGDAEPAAAA
jgi:transposase